MTEQEQFLAQIKSRLDDETLRLVYADWLDEHDQPEEALRQRAAVPAIQWMQQFAKDAGQHCVKNYGRDHVYDYKTGKSKPTGLKEEWVPVTFAMVVQAGIDYVDSHGRETFTQYGSEYLRDAFYGDKGKHHQAYWNNWALIVGGTKPAAPWAASSGIHNPFSCSC